MSISSFLGTQLTVVSSFGTKTSHINKSGLAVVTIECSSRPQKKATAHHLKTRPRKTQPWDINRKPTVYAPLPPLPPDWTLLSDTTDGGGASTGSEAPPVLQAPLASG